MASEIQLYLIRHAIAEERGSEWPDDRRRPLSDEGSARMRKAAKGLAALDVSFDVVLASPLVRARQTAEIVAGAFDERPPIVLTDALAPEGGYADVMAELVKQSQHRRIALVGHEPNLGELAARLAGSRRAFAFKKGAVCRIDLDSIPPAGTGALRWFATSAMLQRLRRT